MTNASLRWCRAWCGCTRRFFRRHFAPQQGQALTYNDEYPNDPNAENSAAAPRDDPNAENSAAPRQGDLPLTLAPCTFDVDGGQYAAAYETKSFTDTTTEESAPVACGEVVRVLEQLNNVTYSLPAVSSPWPPAGGGRLLPAETAVCAL